MVENAFVDLRRLLDWFDASPRRLPAHIVKVTERLGRRCIPLLTRQLCSEDNLRRDAARAALFNLAATPTARAAIIQALRRIIGSNGTDRGKLAALGVLSELGDPATTRFSDPAAVQRSSATAFAAALNTPVDVATAAELIVRQMSFEAVMSFLAVMLQAAPNQAAQLARELCCRHDVAPTLREYIAELVPLGAIPVRCSQPQPRLTRITILERQDVPDSDASAANRRVVIVATRKIAGQRRWRQWAVLIGGMGHIEDCFHEEVDKDADAEQLIGRLISDGFQVVNTEPAKARTMIAAAARSTIARNAVLPAPYYIGRDLLDLADAHLTRAPIHPTSATLGRAVERIAAHDIATAQELLAHCDPTNPDAAAARATCLLLEGQCAAAVDQLRLAIAVEPGWPLHHWNLSVALYRLGDVSGCERALHEFIATSAAPSGLYADPEQVSRVARAMQLIASLERRSQLAAETNRAPHVPTVSAAQATTNRTA